MWVHLLPGEIRLGAAIAANEILDMTPPKEKRTVEYEEVITPVGGDKVTGVMRNFSAGPRIQQVAGPHISIKPSFKSRARFTKPERKIVASKLSGDELSAFKHYLTGH